MDNNRRSKIINLTNSQQILPNDLPNKSFKDDNNGSGGEPPMDDKYVTHKELELSNEKLSHQIDNRFAEINQRLSDIELKINDIKNTTNSNKEKVNWLLYTAIGGIVVSVLTTIISNLLTK